MENKPSQTMLPKEEWKLLVYYYKLAKEDSGGFISPPVNPPENIEKITRARNRLRERGFIDNRDINGKNIYNMHDSPYLRLTTQGEDVALEYSNWFKRTELRFPKLKDHWLWIIIASIMSIGVAIFVQWVCKYF